MGFTTSRSIRLIVLAVLVAALNLPASAGADSRRTAQSASGSAPVRALVANDIDDNGDISTADPLPAPSPVNGQLTFKTDYDDVYSVVLNAGETLSARVSNPTSGADFDLYLFGIGATSVETDIPLARAEAEYSSPDMLYDPATEKQFVAPATGTYYLDVYLLDAPSDTTAYPYVLEYAIGDAPKVTVSSSASTVSFDGSVSLTGVVKDGSDSPMADQAVELWAVGYPYDTFTRKLTGVTGADGSYTFKTTVTRWTRFKVVCVADEPGYAHGVSEPESVKAKAALGAPKWYSGTKRHGRSFTVYGYIKPRHPLGQKHVKITASRLDAGVWRVAKSVSNSATHTKYKTTIVLPYAGKWRLVASTPDDGYHAATTSRSTYVTVK